MKLIHLPRQPLLRPENIFKDYEKPPMLKYLPNQDKPGINLLLLSYIASPTPFLYLRL